MTLTPVAERLAVELSLPVWTTWVCRGWELSACEANALTDCATAAVKFHLKSEFSKPMFTAAFCYSTMYMYLL